MCKAGRQLAPANKRGVALRIGVESPHKGCHPIRWRKRLYPPSALFGSVLDDRDPGRPILHDYSVDLEARRGRSVPQMGKNCMLLYVAEFPFHYDNRENADIFEAAIK
jgi:hypothetical protein